MDEISRTGALSRKIIDNEFVPLSICRLCLLALCTYMYSNIHIHLKNWFSVFFLPENNSIAFRGNTIATKAMESYMKLVGDKVSSNAVYRSRAHCFQYLSHTLVELIRHVFFSVPVIDT